MTMNWVKFLAVVTGAVWLMVGVAAVVYADDDWQRENVCGREVIKSVNERRLLICNEMSITSCNARFPAEVLVYSRDRPLGYPFAEQRGLAMDEYQRSKKLCREARRNYDDELAFTYQQDMVYWETRMQAYGGWSAQANGVMTWAGEEAVKEKIREAIENLIILETLYNLPNLDLRDTRGSEE